ncbi:hypothetical protein H634G_00417 [Metarhizium anisopliae BRIP 53293]|uniref:Fungal N-terminal domain-containing protein n=1 Tax=Metarhizium anisopliae BRIP 53293 TaxID=1291518 RepID=A0A0D9PCS9_METAN|nr:hypothetical protein H634G_00417 [Metarhizium anisopliae BRIP 53293]KJK88984.1 hypothetical protein H633G_07174 [Metarhizium anisopliae BRIP 53284]
MDSNAQQDSPLSTTSNIVGILTFVVAIAAAIYARLNYLRNSDEEYFRVKTSLSWYKTESTWLSDLLRTLGVHYAHDGGAHSRQREYQMYTFVMEDLINLEQRLLDLVTEVESKASTPRGPSNRDDRWTLVPSWQRSTPSVGMAWMSVRTKALELVRQREALTARVQFLQMSMISSRLSDLEARMKWGEFKADENSRKMDGVVENRKGEYNRLETLVQQLLVHGRDAVRLDSPESNHESVRRKPPCICSSTR